MVAVYMYVAGMEWGFGGHIWTHLALLIDHS